MSEFMFGISGTKPSRANAEKIERAAKKHGATLIETNLPGMGYKRWFTARNYGNPFNEQTARAVAAEVEAILG